MSGTEMKLEIVLIPVTDVDRAKRFYSKLGWRLDMDFARGDDYRVIQFTPPGSDCSVMLGKNITPAAPGSLQAVHLVVPDLEATLADLRGRGIKVSEPFHDAGGVFHNIDVRQLTSGFNPQRRSYTSYASFSDPDGNSWIFQEVTARLSADIKPGDARFTPEVLEALGLA